VSAVARPGERPGGQPPGRLLSIGEVLGELVGDFPEISHSKIRFLEERGLVEPQRTPAGYRKFTPADVERLRTVLQLQRDHYMPLKAIAEHLDAMDRGLEERRAPGRPVLVPQAAAEPAPVRLAAPARLRLRRSELREAAGVDEPEALEGARAAGELAAYGIEPRHLRPLRIAVEREMSLIESVGASSTRRGEASGSAGAAENAIGLAAHLGTIREAMVRSALSRIARS